MRTRRPPARPTVYDEAERRVSAAAVDAALAGVRHRPFWLDRADRPPAAPALAGDARADLVVVGGGFAGLWTALRAKERDPGRDVLLLEGRRLAWAASGRNGGFVEPTLTHGRANGLRHAADELATLDALGAANLAGLLDTVARYGIDCDARRVGTLSVAVEPHQVAWACEPESPEQVVLPDAAAVRAVVDSPLYRAGVLDPATVLVDPARLAFGLAAACRTLGVRICERTVVRALARDGAGVAVRTDGGTVAAGRVALATNAFRPLLRATRLHTVPVYDHALVTQPLTSAQRASLGWASGCGVADLSNRFHYYRLTPDGRVLFGGYDAVYHYGRSTAPAHERDDAVTRRLVAHLLATFPQLAGVPVTHAWGGAIDTCNRFFAFYRQGFGDRVAQATGFTGLGVAATRFAADVLLDLLDGLDTPRTALRTVHRAPPPFPPEPVAWLGIAATVAALADADRREGTRGPWLGLLDALRLGFDS